MRYISMCVLAFVVWLLWSGHYALHHTLLIVLGVLSCAFVVYLAGRLAIVDEEGLPIHLVWHVLLYIPWLAWAIIKANIDVAKRILSPKLPIAPRIVRVTGTQKPISVASFLPIQ